MNVVLLRRDVWTRLPDSQIEVMLLRGYDFVLTSRPDGTWELGTVPGTLLVRVVYRSGKRSWPWPITPMPLRHDKSQDLPRSTRRGSSTS